MSFVHPPRATIMLVEDDAADAQVMVDMLEECGYRVFCAESGAQARATLKQRAPDLIILDLGLADTDGLVLCSSITANANVPVIACSGHSQERDRVLSLRLGADDFIQKPFDAEEFEARVRAVLRRAKRSSAADPPTAPPAARDQLRAGELVIDRSRHRVTLAGQPLELTLTEYRLLSALASRLNALVSREELAQVVWGCNDKSIYGSMHVHLHRLRLKLSCGRVPGPRILVERGHGYQLVLGEPDDESADISPD